MAEKIKHNLLIIIVLLIYAPILFTVKAPESWVLNTENFKFIAKYLSSVLGYFGLALLTLEFMLGTRSVSGLFFKDLASKLSLHSKLGKYGLLLVFMHPLFVVYSYGEKFYYSVVPQLGSEFERHVTLGRMAFLGLLIIWVTSALIKSKIAYRPWKYIHYISYPVLFLSLLHVPPIGSSFNQQYIRFFWYLIVSVVLICTALRMRHIFGFSKHPYKIVGHKQISEKIWVMDLKSINKSLTIKTGQYVYVQPNLFSEEHPFSVLNHNDKDATFSIGYKVFGKFTEKMAKAQVDDEILVDGPYGVFTEEINVDPEKPAVFIAGGIGVTPFVKHCLGSTGGRILFYAVRTKSSPAFKNILQPVMGNNLVMIIEKDETPASNNDERGFISKEIITKYLDATKEYEFYICGPEAMMENTKNILRDMGIANKHIHLENFSY